MQHPGSTVIFLSNRKYCLLHRCLGGKVVEYSCIFVFSWGLLDEMKVGACKYLS